MEGRTMNDVKFSKCNFQSDLSLCEILLITLCRTWAFFSYGKVHQEAACGPHSVALQSWLSIPTSPWFSVRASSLCLLTLNFWVKMEADEVYHRDHWQRELTCCFHWAVTYMHVCYLFCSYEHFVCMRVCVCMPGAQRPEEALDLLGVEL